MRESSISHRNAASVLNPMSFSEIQIQQNPSIAQRLIPNFERMKSMGTYLKNGAIAVAAAGGIAAMAHAIKDDGEKRKKPNEEDVIDNIRRTMGEGFITTTTTTTTTKKPEYHNPLGIIYK